MTICDCCFFLASFFIATNRLLEAPLKEINRMNDLLLCIYIVAKTLNLEISRCHLADNVKELYESACRKCSTIIFPYSIIWIIALWRSRCRCCCN